MRREKEVPIVAYRGKMAEADFYFVSAQVKAELKSDIARHYNVEEENTVCKVTKQGEGFTSLITVIDAQPGRPLSIEKLPVRSALKQTDYPETMAEALKITAGEKGICGDPLPSGGQFADRPRGGGRLHGLRKCDRF